MLQQKTTVIDLNWLLSYSGILIPPVRRVTAHEQRTNSVFANSRFYSKTPIQNLCQSLRRQSSHQIILLLRSILDNGLCSTDVSRQFTRCRNLLACLARQTVSLWLSRANFPKHVSRCQRKKRLANLSRFCTDTDQKSKASLRRRRLWRHPGKYGLCLGRNRYRSVLVAVPMGPVPQTQKCRKIAYTHGLERCHTHVHTHYKRFAEALCQLHKARP